MKRGWRFPRTVWGWALYDWANSAFATTVMAGCFPVFFKSYWSYGVDVNESTALLGAGNSVAFLIVAVMAPILGGVADRASAKKRLLLLFAYLGVLMTAALSMVGKGQWGVAVLVYAIAIIAFSGANNFYDALLPGVAPEGEVDLVSGLGFSLGYLGGGLLFAMNVWMTISPHRFGLPDAAAAVRLSFLTVALWWGGFTLFTAFWVKEAHAVPPSGHRESAGVLRSLVSTMKSLRRHPNILLFLLAYWFYIDGVDTIIVMAVDYGLSIGFSSNDLILSLLLVQFIGFPAALAFGKLGQRWGARKSIFLGVGIYMAITLWGTLIQRREEFYLLAAGIGLVQGGVQALSRSYYCRLIPPERSGEFFGFYNMLGKFAAIIGPSLVGLVTLAVRSIGMPGSPQPEDLIRVSRLASRWGIGSIALLFLIGGVLFYLAKEGRDGKVNSKQ
jgi:UMF1 family MFS transporter